MKLLTKQIINSLPKFYETESIPLEEKSIVAKYFNPAGDGTWYVIEGEEHGDVFMFFGLIDLYGKDLGHFSLKELESIRFPWGLKIERDIHFTGEKVGDILGY